MADRDLSQQLTIPTSGFRDLATIAKHADKLPKIREALKAIGPADSIKVLAQHMSTPTGIEAEELQKILRGLVGLAPLIGCAKAPPEQIVDSLTDLLEREAPQTWKDNSLAQWREAKGEISSAIEWASQDEALFAIAKIKQLTYAHQNILTHVRIIDDLRPVYSKDGTRILHMIICYSLLVEYHDGDSRRIELAIDAADVAEIKRACERAQRKTVAAKEALKSLSIGITVPRDVGDLSDEDASSPNGDDDASD